MSLTRTQLRSLFRNLIDDTGNSPIFTDLRINELLYEGAQQVQDLITEYDEKYFVETESISVQGDQLKVPIPDARQVLHVRRTDVTPNKDFTYIDLRNLTEWRRKYGEDNENNPAYSLRGNTLVYPSTLGSDHTLEVELIKSISNIQDDEEAFEEIPEIGQRFIAYEAVYIGLISEDSDVTQFSRLRNEMRLKLIRNIDSRNRQTRYVRDWTD